jgi:hypothetical protein
MIHNSDTYKYEHANIERLCNEVAGKVLLRDEAIYNDSIITKLATHQDVNLGHIEEIANNLQN